MFKIIRSWFKTNEETIVAPLTGAVKILKKYQIQYLLVV